MVYAKNFLSNVIAKLDYEPILVLDKEQPSEIQEQLRGEYPRFEERRGVGIQFPKEGGPPVSVENLPVIWTLKDKEQANVIELSSKHLAFVSSKYVRFTDFFNRLQNVYDRFVEIYHPEIIKRIGLRFINQIKIDGDPFDWKNLLNDKLYSTLNAFPSLRDSITRSMHQLHLRIDDYKIIFQFGAFNSEFPNTITQKEFILDYDCISEEEHEPNNVLVKFKQFNTQISDLFEQSINANLREIMKKGDLK